MQMLSPLGPSACRIRHVVFPFSSDRDSHLLGGEGRAVLCRRADEQLMGVEMRERECQTDNEESKKHTTTELSSINHKISHTEGVGQKQEELVDKESKALGEATEKARSILVRLNIHQTKLEERKQALDALREEQNAVDARMCRRFSESSEAVHALTTPPQDVGLDQTRQCFR